MKNNEEIIKEFDMYFPQWGETQSESTDTHKERVKSFLLSALSQIREEAESKGAIQMENSIQNDRKETRNQTIEECLEIIKKREFEIGTQQIGSSEFQRGRLSELKIFRQIFQSLKKK